MAFGAIAGLIGSGVLSAAGSEAARTSTVEGAKLQAEQERLAQEFQTEQFEKSLERQQPFLEAGQEASPLLTLAIRNELGNSRLPAAELRKSILAANLEGAPEFVGERQGRAIDAIESENQKSRLLDLVQIGLGSAGAASGTRANIGATTAVSLGRIGNISADALNQSAIMRQNTANRTFDTLGGLPAYLSTLRRGQPLRGGTALTNTGARVPVA